MDIRSGLEDARAYIKEEVKWEKIRVGMDKKAIKYEEKLIRGKGSKLAKRCWEEVKKKKWETSWSEKRREENFTRKEITRQRQWKKKKENMR